MHVDVSDFLIWLVVGALGWLVRELRSIRKWRQIRAEARRELADPAGTDVPEVAVAHAATKANIGRIKRESISIARRNGIHKT